MRIIIETKPNDENPINFLTRQAEDLANSRAQARHLSDEVFKLENGSREKDAKIKSLEVALAQNGKTSPIRTLLEAQTRALVGATTIGKIQSIKMIREITGLGLKEAKDLYEGGAHQAKLDDDDARARRGY
jgi:ribosomal protein L7/L12